MDCRKMECYLSEYVDGELSARDRRRLEAHLEKCPDCKNELRRMADEIAFLRNKLSSFQLSRENRSELKKSILANLPEAYPSEVERLAAARVPWWERRISVPLPVAALVVAVLCALVVLQLPFRMRGAPDSIASSPVELPRVKTHERERVTPEIASVGKLSYYERAFYIGGIGFVDQKRGYRFANGEG